MSKKEIGNIPRIARELIEHLPKEIDDDLKTLVARAEEGQDTTVEIVNLFGQNKHTHQWLKENIKLLGGEKSAIRGEHSPLAGNPSWIRPSQKWVCPINPDEHWFMVMQEEEDPPTCEKHNIEMVRERKKKG